MANVNKINISDDNIDTIVCFSGSNGTRCVTVEYANRKPTYCGDVAKAPYFNFWNEIEWQHPDEYELSVKTEPAGITRTYTRIR